MYLLYLLALFTIHSFENGMRMAVVLGFWNITLYSMGDMQVEVFVWDNTVQYWCRTYEDVEESIIVLKAIIIMNK